MTTLLEAAKTVVENWYQNKAVVDSIEALCQAVQAEQDVPVYTPMTHDERRLSGVLDTEFTDREHGVVFIERAVIERLGMRWPE